MNDLCIIRFVAEYAIDIRLRVISNIFGFSRGIKPKRGNSNVRRQEVSLQRVRQ